MIKFIYVNLDAEDNNDVTEGNIEKATTYYEIKAEAVTRPVFGMKTKK